MKFYLSLLSVFFIFACDQSHITKSDWRGINRSGQYNETNLLKSWPQNGPELLWETSLLGSGFGSPIIASKRLFIEGTEDSSAILFSYDLNGKLLYKTVVGQEWVSHFPGARSTPAVADNMVYVMTGKGDLSCLQMKSGKVLWQKSMVNDFGGFSPMFGYAESPLIDGDKIYCTPGGPEFNVVALNRFTGALIWSCKGKGEYSAYNSPAIFTVGGRKIIADFSSHHLLGIDAETGELLWTHEQTNVPVEKRTLGAGDTHSNTVLVEDNILYYFEGDGNCAVALQLSNDGKEIRQLWNNKSISNYMGGIVKQDSNIFSNGFPRQKLFRVSSSSGNITDSLSIGRGTIILADNMLYYYNDQGEVHLVGYKTGKLTDVSSFKITKGSREHFSHPVIDNGVMYIRHGEYLGAYKISN
jgi:outer membrane protein assembly factor BamB